MKPWTKWQDWSTLALGVLLFFTPFVLASLNAPHSLESTTQFSAPSAWDAWSVGVLLVVVSLWALARHRGDGGGKPFTGDLHAILLHSHLLITLAYHSPGVKPDISYDWNGL